MVSSFIHRVGLRKLVGLCAAATLVQPCMGQALSYDSEGRLIEARYDASHVISYGYDAVGNITSLVISATQNETDSDADAMPDAWEWVFFNTLTNAAGGDPNLNGKDNLWEYQHGYDPLDPDSDDDGVPNAEEIVAGTDPLDSSSIFEVSGFELQSTGGSGVVVRWSSVSNKRYRLERATNLLGNSWTPVFTNIPAMAPMNTVTDTTAVGNGPRGYRIQVE